MTLSPDGPDVTNYWQYFNLQRDPFAMNADADLYFVSAKWEETLDLLQYISHYKNQIMLVTGESGSGKTTLAELLLNQIGDTMTVARLSAEANFDVTRLVEFLSDAYGVPWQPDQALEQMLDEELSAMQLKDKPCLLVIDNAHLLPVETLEALLYLVGQQSDHQMHLHVLLLADPTLLQTFQALLEPNEEYLLHTLMLEPLVMDETAHYLGHRLAASGLQEDFPLTDEIITRIYRLSEGNPARINRIARRALLDMLSQEKNSEKQSVMQRYSNKLVGSAVVLVVLIAGAVWLMNKANQPTKTTPSISLNGQELASTTDNKTVDLPLPTAGSAPETSTVATPAEQTAPNATVSNNTAPVEPSSTVADSSSTTPASTTASTTTASTPTVSTPPASSDSSTTAPTAATTSSAPATPAALAPTAPLPKPVLLNSHSEASTHDASMPVVNETSAPMVTAETKPNTEVAQPIVASAKTAVEPAVSTTPSGATDKTVTATEKAKAVEKAKPAGAYALQLLDIRTVTELKAFYQKHPPLRHKLRVVHGLHGSIKVYYGSYPTMAAASQALTTAPAALQEVKLWPNKVSKA